MDGKKKLEELVAGLDGVTPGFGRWIRLFGDRTVYTRDPTDGCRLQAVVRADDPGKNAILDHIARCDPDTIRSISDAFKALEAERGALLFVVGEYAHAADVGENVNPGVSNLASALLGDNDGLKRGAVEAALSQAKEGRR